MSSRMNATGKTRPMDPVLLGATLLLLSFGLVMVFSSSTFFARKHFGDEFHFFFKQLAFAFVGLLGLFAASRFPYPTLRKLALPILGFTVLVLLSVLILGDASHGARRWLSLGPISIQPSEFAKISLIVYLAYSLSKERANEDGFVSSVLNHLVFPSIVLFLIVVEPDFGTMFLLATIAALMLVAGGSRWKYLVALFVAFLFFSTVLAMVFPHISMRLKAFADQLSFLSEEQNYRILAYQVRESLISFGSGQAWGMGLGQGTMKMFFLPEAHNDFILATIGQELGFAGVFTLFLLFAIVTFRGYLIALRVPDTFGCYLAFGLTSMLLIQFIINAGVVLGLLPPKGIALPLISYGGSSLTATLLVIGILLSISRHTIQFGNSRRSPL